jgi:hypothetical protein
MEEVLAELNVRNGSVIEVDTETSPVSIQYIRKSWMEKSSATKR